MRKLKDIAQIVETKMVRGEPYEIWATATAQYDEAGSKLVVELESFVRRVNLRGADADFKRAWLPALDTVKDSVPIEEAYLEANEIFSRWAHRVRASIPSTSELEAELHKAPA